MYTETKAHWGTLQFLTFSMRDASLEPVQTKRERWVMFFHISALTITQPYVNETFAICQYFHKYHKQFGQIMALIHEGTSAGAWL